MRVLIVGAYGMLGHKLAGALSPEFDVYATCRVPKRYPRFTFPTERLVPGVDADRFDSLIEAIALVRPAAVVNCVGLIKQQSASKDPVPGLTINALFPHRLAKLCAAAGARMIHFSTDCVFAGTKGNYTETDVADATDLYGRTKYLGEVAAPHVVTIRSSIIGPELEAQLGLFGWLASQRGKTVKGFKRAIYTGFPTVEMAEIVARILRDHPGLNGVYQIASAPISKFDLLELINDTLGLGIRIEPDEKFVCDRSLDGSRFTAETGYQAPAWSALVEKMARDAAEYMK